MSKTKISQKSTGHPEGTVIVAIDTNQSMDGENMKLIQDSVIDLISGAPFYVRFVVKTFNSKFDTVTLVVKKKAFLDIFRLNSEIAKSCSGDSSLFDGWKNCLDSIPYEARKYDFVYMIIYSDGVDATSNTPLKDLVRNIKVKMEEFPLLKLVYCQIGDNQKTMNILTEKLRDSRFAVLNLNDEDEKLQDLITYRRRNTGDLEKIAKTLAACLSITDSESDTFKKGHKTMSYDRCGANFHYKTKQKNNCQSSSHCSTKQTHPQKYSGKGGKENYFKQGFSYKVLATFRRPIPAPDVHLFFSQWGECGIVNFLGSSCGLQVLIGYTTEAGKNRALKQGNGQFLHGERVRVQNFCG